MLTITCLPQKCNIQKLSWCIKIKLSWLAMSPCYVKTMSALFILKKLILLLPLYNVSYRSKYMCPQNSSLFFASESKFMCKILLRYAFVTARSILCRYQSCQCLCCASERSHTWDKYVTCCGYLLSLTTASINSCKRQALALEGCNSITYLIYQASGSEALSAYQSSCQ